MDANRLRAWFIERQLQRALATSDMTFARKAAREFRRYVEWFKHFFPERDKARIASQLWMLENKVARYDQRDPASSLKRASEVTRDF